MNHTQSRAAACIVATLALTLPAQAAIVRNTLPLTPPASTSFIRGNPSFAKSGDPFGGVFRYMAVTQTITPAQSGAVATFRFDTVILTDPANGSFFGENGDFHPVFGRLTTNPLPIRVSWWKAALFNPADLSQGFVFSEVLDRAAPTPTFSGTNITISKATFRMTYTPTIPQTDVTTTYLMAFAGATASGLGSLDVQSAIRRPGTIVEFSPDNIFGRDPPPDDLAVYFGPLTGVNQVLPVISAYLDIPNVPEPTGLVGGALGLGALVLPRRQRRA